MKNELVAEAYELLETNSTQYHLVGAWVAVCLNPLFAVSEYVIFPDYWIRLLSIRLLVSGTILAAIVLRKRLSISSPALISIPFLLLALQNAHTYLYLKPENVLGHNLNYMALFIGGAMFILWKWPYSIVVLLVSFATSMLFIHANTFIPYSSFFVKGGTLLIASGVFMLILIQTRYKLTMAAILAQLELKKSKLLLEQQAEEIRTMNENLEHRIKERTMELHKKNLALEDYAFMNSHQLRAPVATILGLTNLLRYVQLKKDDQEIIDRMRTATENLDAIVKEITSKIEKA